ncbi:MAG: 16S rRNA processing protein RimM [Selenomonadaceae bacterium]|nr:16S rRNA processing protein RimM [Selenomonadaceae bacterium]MBP3721871.1 16S rRNA processing protein RimM [Selenomonadaceae bacterium]
MTKSSLSEDRIIVGKIGKAYGLKGEARIISLTDFPERFFGMEEIAVGDRIFRVDSVREDSKSVLIKFQNINSPEEVSLLRGKLLTVDKKDAAPLAEGEYYTFDIIGLNVYDTRNNRLGEVVNVLKTGSNDVYEAKNEDGKELLIPALKKVVKEIDVSGKRMVVDLAEMETLEK